MAYFFTLGSLNQSWTLCGVLGSALVVSVLVCCVLINRQRTITRLLTGLVAEQDHTPGFWGCGTLLDRITEGYEHIGLREHAVRTAEKRLDERIIEHRRAVERARNVAKAELRAQRELPGNISHELRTPLVGVLGFGDLLLRTDLTTDQRQFVGHILSSGRALLARLDDLLGFFQLEAGKYKEETAELDLRQLIGSVVERRTPQSGPQNPQLSFVVARTVPAGIRQDSKHLRQVLDHLVGNAIKFTTRGAVSIRVTHADCSGPPRLRFTVQDTGIGIPSQDLSSVFDPFHQVDSSDSRRFEGMGLGLAICRRIVEKLGGSLEVASTLGVGSSFWFEIPFEEIVADDVPVVVDGIVGSPQVEDSRPTPCQAEHDRVDGCSAGMPLPFAVQESGVVTYQGV